MPTEKNETIQTNTDVSTETIDNKGWSGTVRVTNSTGEIICNSNIVVGSISALVERYTDD